MIVSTPPIEAKISRSPYFTIMKWACRNYQRLFREDQEAKYLQEIHVRDRDRHRAEYFRSQFDKAGRLLPQFDAFVPDLADSQVLDFGCGGGGITFRLAERARATWGIDVNAQALEFPRAEAERVCRTDIHFGAYDGTRLPFEDAYFDHVFSIDVVEHLPDPSGSLAEIARVLKPGGLLLLSFGPPWLHAHGEHMFEFFPGWWSHVLFPRSVLMEIRGAPPETTWEQIGLHRLTVAKFEKAARSVKSDGLELVHREFHGKRITAPLWRVWGLREFFIGEVMAVFRKQSISPPA